MKKLSIILSAFVFILIISSCGGSKEKEATEETIENTEETTTDEVESTSTAKNPSQILIGGSWNNPEALRSEDVIFNEGGNMIWRSGSDEGESKWSVKGDNVLNFYGKDYKIEKLSETKLVVSNDGTKTTYERNVIAETSCDATFAIEGTNDAKGEYKAGSNESWTIHFSEGEQDFIAFYTKDGKQDDAIIIEKIEKISDCEFKIVMKGISGEKVPSWILKYNSDKKFYDLYVHSYDAGTDTWSDKTFSGSEDNG